MTHTPSPRTQGADALLAMSGVTVELGRTVALQDVTLEVYPHQVVGVLGPNAAGKSTLLGVAAGSVRPTSGRVAWRGTERTGRRPKRQPRPTISRTTQTVDLDDRTPVVENVMAGADGPARPGPLAGLLPRPRSRPEDRELKDHALAILHEVGIARYADHEPAGLPTAVRRRVVLARALVTQPELLLLDELAGGLSPDERHDLGRTIRRLSRRRSVVLVEHHLDMMVRFCDHLVVLDAGRVIARGAPRDVSTHPAVVSAYLGDDPR